MHDSVELDSVDWRILEELQNDATLPNRVLAERVGLAASSCLQRVRRLREQGVITGSHIDVNPAATGLVLEAVVAINVRPHTREIVAMFREFVMAQPETRSLLHVSGQADFLLHVAVADTKHLQEFLTPGHSPRQGTYAPSAVAAPPTTDHRQFQLKLSIWDPNFS